MEVDYVTRQVVRLDSTTTQGTIDVIYASVTVLHVMMDRPAQPVTLTTMSTRRVPAQHVVQTAMHVMTRMVAQLVKMVPTWILINPAKIVQAHAINAAVQPLVASVRRVTISTTLADALPVSPDVQHAWMGNPVNSVILASVTMLTNRNVSPHP